MRFPLLLATIAALVLRGMTVPHAHAGGDGGRDHVVRPHVHLAVLSDRHAHSHDHQHRHGGGHGHAHVQYDIAADHGDTANGLPSSPPASDHDDDAVYFADGSVMLIPAVRSSPTEAAVSWLAVQAIRVFGPPSVVEPPFRHVRPPGDGAATIHSLLPHMLRV